MDERMDEVKKTVDDIETWLKAPQMHFDGQARRKLLENIIAQHVDKMLRKQALRNRAKDFLLIGAVATSLLTVAPKVLAFLGVTWP